MKRAIVSFLVFVLGLASQVSLACAKEEGWGFAPESKLALAQSLDWLRRNNGKDCYWEAGQLELVSLELQAFLADGQLPEQGKYGETAQGALGYILKKQKKSRLSNTSHDRNGLYSRGTTKGQRVRAALKRVLPLPIKVRRKGGGRRASGLFCTSTACFALAIPNCRLPILQKGRMTGLKHKD